MRDESNTKFIKGTPKVDKVGQKYGILTIIEYMGLYEHNSYWKCRCDCSRVIISTLFRITRAKSCGCLKKVVGNKHPNWKGYGEISASRWDALLKRASNRKQKIDIDIKYAWELFLKQDRKCAITGLPIFFGLTLQSKYKEWTASLDRIDSKKGYVKGNVQWVHKWINIMKWDLPVETFIEVCNVVSNKYPVQDKNNKFLINNIESFENNKNFAEKENGKFLEIIG